MLKLRNTTSPTGVELISKAAAKTAAENREMLLKVLSSLQFLLRQGLAVRGHTEAEGRLMQPLHLKE